jgi:hypothetical protein
VEVGWEGIAIEEDISVVIKIQKYCIECKEVILSAMVWK